jgi:hypothetical protein
VTTWDEWSFIPASFLAMRQKGFGVPSPNGELDRSTISRVQVLFSAGSWDFWVDNVSLFKAPP